MRINTLAQRDSEKAGVVWPGPLLGKKGNPAPAEQYGHAGHTGLAAGERPLEDVRGALALPQGRPRSPVGPVALVRRPAGTKPGFACADDLDRRRLTRRAVVDGEEVAVAPPGRAKDRQHAIRPGIGWQMRRKVPDRSPGRKPPVH